MFAKNCRSAEQRGGAREACLFSLNCYVLSRDSTQKAYCCHVRCMRGKGGLKHLRYSYFNLPFSLLSVSCSLSCYTTFIYSSCMWTDGLRLFCHKKVKFPLPTHPFWTGLQNEGSSCSRCSQASPSPIQTKPLTSVCLLVWIRPVRYGLYIPNCLFIVPFTPGINICGRLLWSLHPLALPKSSSSCDFKDAATFFSRTAPL